MGWMYAVVVMGGGGYTGWIYGVVVMGFYEEWEGINDVMEDTEEISRTVDRLHYVIGIT